MAESPLKRQLASNSLGNLITPVESARVRVGCDGCRGAIVGQAAIDELNSVFSVTNGLADRSNSVERTLKGYAAIDELGGFGSRNFGGEGVVESAIGELHDVVSVGSFSFDVFSIAGIASRKNAVFFRKVQEIASVKFR